MKHDVDFYDEAALNPMPAGEIRAFYLRKYPNSRSFSCLIMGTPEGVVITGDTVPGKHRGAISARGYGLKWFAESSSPSYLAEKFLRTEYRPERCREAVELMIEMEEERETPDVGVLERLRAILADENIFENVYKFIDAVPESYFQMAYDWKYYSYNPFDVGLLAAIQRRFAETVAEMRRTGNDPLA